MSRSQEFPCFNVTVNLNSLHSLFASRVCLLLIPGIILCLFTRFETLFNSKQLECSAYSATQFSNPIHPNFISFYPEQRISFTTCLMELLAAVQRDGKRKRALELFSELLTFIADFLRSFRVLLAAAGGEVLQSREVFLTNE